jgi:hypothetical protein
MDVSHYLTKYPLAFVAISIGNEPEIASVLLASQIKLPTHNSYVITFNEDSAEKFRDKIGFSKEINVITYEDIDLEILKNIKYSTIVFDSLSNIDLVNIENKHAFDAIKHLEKNENWVIIVGDGKTTPREIKNLSETFPKTHFWNDKFIDFGNCLNFVLNKSKMTEIQEIRYSFSENYYYKTLGLIPDNHSWMTENYPNIKRFCNIVYPASVQSMIENTEKENEMLPNPDVLFESFGINSILQNSPKFQQLFNKINFSRKQRHVIFTNYENYFGTSILEALFKSTDIPTVKIDSEQTDEQNKENMKKFNEDDSIKILIVSIAFPEPPKNVDVFHIIDSNLQEAYSKIYQIYKYSNYTKSRIMPPKLTIEMYCTSKRDGKSIDDITFDEFFPYVLNQRDFWKFVKESSLFLVVNARNRLDAIV